MVRQTKKVPRTPAPKQNRTRRKRHKGHKLRTALVIMGLCVVISVGGLLAYLRGSNPATMGIDISHHQGEIDWTEVAASGQVQFVYVKASEGVKLDDECYQKNVKEARDQGLMVGAYHFFRSDADGEKQFEHFKRAAGRDFDLIPMLDLEADGGKIADKAEYRRQVEAFVQCCEREYGTPPVLYSGISFWKDFVQPAASWCPYWAAWYPMKKTEPGLKGLLQVVKGRIITWLTGWSGRKKMMDLTHPDLGAMTWQYSDRGHIPGIKGYVDMDECWDIEKLKWKHVKKKKKPIY